MAANLQVLRRRIKTVTSTRKITKAQELVASSRIGKAQERVEASRPYAESITNVLTELSRNARVDHPLLATGGRVDRAAVLLVTSDRGLCGGYNANVLRAAEQLITKLRADGKQPALYVIGRKGVTYFRFRDRPLEQSWTGFSERPAFTDAKAVGEAVTGAFLAEARGVQELYLVHTRFRSLMTQTPVTSRLAPLEIETKPATGPVAMYEFEPEADQLLAALLPRYINARIYAALLDSAASESASRRRAMKSATDNADELITMYTREMNSARQAAITQEISEIVGGANALAAAGSEER